MASHFSFLNVLESLEIANTIPKINDDKTDIPGREIALKESCIFWTFNFAFIFCWPYWTRFFWVIFNEQRGINWIPPPCYFSYYVGNTFFSTIITFLMCHLLVGSFEQINVLCKKRTFYRIFNKKFSWNVYDNTK